MEANNIKYTNAALEQLEKFKLDQVKKLEDLIVENKRFPGVDFIEITASDIQEEARKFTHFKPAIKTQIRYLVIYVYFVTGIGLMLFGFLYNDIIDIWKNQPIQGLYILMGFIMTIISSILFFYIRYREKIRSYEHSKYVEYLNITEKIYFDELLKNINEDRNKSAQYIDNKNKS